MAEKITTQVAIVGAGPAGTTCALHLANKGIKSVLIDKSSFPRDKICGDAISGNSVFEIEKLGLEFPSLFNAFNEKLPTGGITFVAPSGQPLTLQLKKVRSGFSHAGYVSKRFDFDNFLMDQCKQNPMILVLENSTITEVKEETNGLELITHDKKINAELIVGADGAHSVIAKLANRSNNKEHVSAGLRQYWTNVTGFDALNSIELHFIKDALPGYFWIFPLPNNMANVGIGIKSSVVSKKKLNLKNLLHEIITTHPTIAPRFKNATPNEEPKGFGLPLGSVKVKVSGNRFILAGDAASLIDPFTGEGIGNAMTSGRIAADHIEKCVEAQSFDSVFNTMYDQALYKKLHPDLTTSYQLQKMVNRAWLFNWIVKKANKNRHIKTFLEDMLDDPTQRKQISRPSFYYKLIFNPKSS